MPLMNPGVVALLAAHHQALLREWDAAQATRTTSPSVKHLTAAHLRVAQQRVATIEARLRPATRAA